MSARRVSITDTERCRHCGQPIIPCPCDQQPEHWVVGLPFGDLCASNDADGGAHEPAIPTHTTHREQP